MGLLLPSEGLASMKERVPPMDVPLFILHAHDLWTCVLGVFEHRPIPTEARATIQANVLFAGGEAAYRRRMWRSAPRRAAAKSTGVWPIVRAEQPVANVTNLAERKRK